MDTDTAGHEVYASIYFLRPNELFKEEKPYAFRYDVDEHDSNQSNLKMEQRQKIKVKDIRDSTTDVSIQKNGFCIIPLKSQMNYDDFHIKERLPIYLNELEAVVRQLFGATEVFAFRHGLRKRHENFPLSTGEPYEYDQPTSVAHIDTTTEEMFKEFERQSLATRIGFEVKRLQWVNVWKPLRGPTNDWPLLMCDSSTVNSENDLEAADLLYPDLATENYQVYYSSNYQWYYLSNHEPHELAVFVQADSYETSLPGVPHCSFYNELTPKAEPPRESIEVRLLVLYDSL